MRKKYSAKLINKLNHARKNLVEVKSSNSFRKDYKALDDAGLNPTQRAVLTYIYDNMKQSIQNKGFYDKKRHNYYAVVTRKTVADIYNINEDTVSNMLDQLQMIGYIQKVQSWNSGVKVFVKHFVCDSSETGNIPESRTEKIAPNKNELYKNNSSTNNTEHTNSSELNQDDKIKKFVYDAVKSILPSKASKENKQDEVIDDKKDDDHVTYATLGTKSMPEKASKNINIMSSNLYGNDKKKKGKFIYKVNGMIYKAKSFVAKKHNLYNQFRWENNPTLAQSFSQSIYEMLYAAYSGTRDFKCPKDAYFFGALKKFFTKFTHKDTQKSSKQKESSTKGNHRIKEQVPEFIEHPERHTGNKLNPKKKAAIQARLKRLDAKLD